jgi:hypothetical protein
VVIQDRKIRQDSRACFGKGVEGLEWILARMISGDPFGQDTVRDGGERMALLAGGRQEVSPETQ